MLIAAQYPGILGDKAPAANIGKFEAKGWEGILNWADKIGAVNYHVGATITYATNKLVDMGLPRYCQAVLTRLNKVIR